MTAWATRGGGAVALPQGVDPVLAAAARAAMAGYADARAAHTREELAETVAEGADGTPTMRIDVLVESRILEALDGHGAAAGRPVNVLSEEAGFIDRGSAVTLVMDPLDGSANGAAGVPLTAFSAALAVDGEFTEALTLWTDTGHTWWARTGTPTPHHPPATPGMAGADRGGWSGGPEMSGGEAGMGSVRPGVAGAESEAGSVRPGVAGGEAGAGSVPAGVGVASAGECRTSGCVELDGAAVSLLRPHTGRPGPAAAWWAAATRAARVRILSSSCLEAALVAEGATDAFADAATDTHRLVDLAAALVLLPAAGGAVRDVFGRPIEFDTDLTRRWSGVAAATPALAESLAETLREHALTHP